MAATVAEPVTLCAKYVARMPYEARDAMRMMKYAPIAPMMLRGGCRSGTDCGVGGSARLNCSTVDATHISFDRKDTAPRLLPPPSPAEKTFSRRETLRHRSH
jgi:hypothetical protein